VGAQPPRGSPVSISDDVRVYTIHESDHASDNEDEAQVTPGGKGIGACRTLPLRVPSAMLFSQLDVDEANEAIP